MSTRVDIPKLDWFERYRRLIDIAWGILLADEDFVFRNFSREELTRFSQKTRPRWSKAVAEKLIKKCDLKPDIEGAVKLLGVYSQEVWGFGDARYCEAKLETPTKGIFANLVCRGWEKETEHCKKTQCDIACAAEYAGVISALSPQLKVTLAKARPRGDHCCEYTIELSSTNVTEGVAP